ncbi:MAG: hypothetical protein Q8N99_06920 [Nanoarchaeota archaeon]|nr:hypothetical protein [Nanoarchaeota archaeon]
MARQNLRQLTLPGMELEDIADENPKSNPLSNSRQPKKRKGLRLMVYGLIGAMTLGGAGYLTYDLNKTLKELDALSNMEKVNIAEDIGDVINEVLNHYTSKNPDSDKGKYYDKK